MADILIRGVEMPKGDNTISITIFSNGKVSLAHDKKYAEYAEAVPLPAEHGRLIDADELQHIMGSFSLAWEYGQGVSDCFAALLSAPTIIKAEGDF